MLPTKMTDILVIASFKTGLTNPVIFIIIVYMNITKKQSDRLSKFLSACGGMIKRPPLTKLYYKRLNNRVWYDLKIFKKEEFESFNTLLETKDNGEFIHAVEVENFVRILFNKYDYSTLYAILPREQRNKIQKVQEIFSTLINPNYATVIFCKKNTHSAMKKLLDKIGITAQIVNGDYTTNLACEARTKSFIHSEHNKGNTQDLSILMDNMGNRSYSVSEIKNLILMIDDCCFASLMQKLGRGLTPNKTIDYCNVIDFRTKKTLEGHLYTFVTGHIDDKINNGKTEISNERKHLLVEQITLQDYFNNGIFDDCPIVKLSEQEIQHLIEQNNYAKKVLSIVLEQRFNIMLSKITVIDPTVYQNYKSKNPALQTSTFLNNINGGKTIGSQNNQKDKKIPDDSKNEHADDRIIEEKALQYHIDWFINNYIYIFRQFCTMFDNHIILQGFNTGMLFQFLQELPDYKLDLNICRIVIEEFDNSMYDLFDTELKKSLFI